MVRNYLILQEKCGKNFHPLRLNNLSGNVLFLKIVSIRVTIMLINTVCRLSASSDIPSIYGLTNSRSTQAHMAVLGVLWSD